MFRTREVNIGGVALGGSNPVRIQSMTSTATENIEATVKQSIQLIEAGSEYVRITAPSLKTAQYLKEIKKQIRQAGYTTPLIADIHFNPSAAEIAARHVEKIRINPGNYIDRKYIRNSYTPKQYHEELERISERIQALLRICKDNATVIRIGTNHGSLSTRILERFGNTAEGMVESTLEYIHICRQHDFHDLVLSLKSSNLRVMLDSYRLLVKRMAELGYDYPLHLGVTEAGDAEDGRIKSAAGIGTLLAEGIGDTIRVSLTENPVKELPVAKKIVSYANDLIKQQNKRSHFEHYQIQSSAVDINPLVISSVESKRADLYAVDDYLIDRTGKKADLQRKETASKRTDKLPGIIKAIYKDTDTESCMLKAAIDYTMPLLSGDCKGVWIENKNLHSEFLVQTAFNILQATGTRISKTEFISCPSCGRTMFDIEGTLKNIKARTSHLKGLKIGVMGCIVNGPGEMADAHYGYVGSGKGKVTLYKNGEVEKRNIDESMAIDELIKLIKLHGDWVEL